MARLSYDVESYLISSITPNMSLLVNNPWISDYSTISYRLHAVADYDPGKGYIDVPNCMHIRNIISSIQENPDLTASRFIQRFWVAEDSLKRRTIATCLKGLSMSPGGKLIKVETHKGEIYHGCIGAILDKDYSPLILGVNRTYLDSYVRERIIYIHPKVFSNQDMISKAIVRTFLPFYATRTIRVIVEAPTMFVAEKVPEAQMAFPSSIVAPYAREIANFYSHV